MNLGNKTLCDYCKTKAARKTRHKKEKVEVTHLPVNAEENPEVVEEPPHVETHEGEAQNPKKLALIELLNVKF